MNRFGLRLVAWEMTRACNLACVHCRAGACPQPEIDELSFEEGCELIDGIAKVAKPILIMTGGEPLLRSDFFDLARYAIQRGLRAVLATNGVLVDDAVARKIASLGIPRVSVSLDGPTSEEHNAFRMVSGAFEASLEGIDNLRKAGVAIQINTTLTKRNRNKLAEMMRLAESIGACAFHLFLLVPTGRARQMSGEEMEPKDYEETLTSYYRLSRKSKMETKATCAPQYYRIMRQQAMSEGVEISETNFVMNAKTRGCLAGLSFAFVSHRGEVQPCGYFDIQVGSVRESRFGDIWESAPLFKDLRDFGLLKGKCGKCNYLSFCGGCRARAYEASGSYVAPDPYCAYFPHTLRI